MSGERRPPIAVTLGDPAGVGAEVTLKALRDEVERGPDRLIEEAKTKAKKGSDGKKLRGYQRDVKLIEVGD